MRQVVLVLLAFAFLACNETTGEFTDSKDYNSYLATDKAPKTTSKFYRLWNTKITVDSTELLSFGNVASEYNRFFKNTGEISYLKKAEQALQKAVEIANINKESYARALARNYISQHRFAEALEMAQLADSIGGGKNETQSLFFDVHMELGNYDKAEKHLENIKNFSDFGYLIRLAKWNDYKGDLDTTIAMMEKALAKAESANNKSLKLWSYTNIADYYGHAGRLKDSYDYYLKALAIDPNNAYAKKGIAWIVFSHEKNGAEALRILDLVTEKYESPDYFLLKAEIAEFMKNEVEYAANMDSYFEATQDASYGEMYNAYTVDFYLNHARDEERALNLAYREVENRPTPESYDLLASAYLKMGKVEKALAVVESQIIGKTFEPGILLNVAKIYKANSELAKVAALKGELLGAVYELGPSSKDEIEQL